MNKFNPNIHRRRSVRLKDYDYSQAGAYFVTICSYQKECVFGEVVDGKMQLNEYGKIVQEEWLKTAEIRINILLDSFIVMPNHLHGIIILTNNFVGATCRVAPNEFGPRSGSIGAIIGQFKSAVTKRINAVRKIIEPPIWQRNYHEHIIRNDDNLDHIREYVLNNPLKWDLDLDNPSNLIRSSILGRPDRSPLQKVGFS